MREPPRLDVLGVRGELGPAGAAGAALGCQLALHLYSQLNSAFGPVFSVYFFYVPTTHSLPVTTL